MQMQQAWHRAKPGGTSVWIVMDDPAEGRQGFIHALLGHRFLRNISDIIAHILSTIFDLMLPRTLQWASLR